MLNERTYFVKGMHCASCEIIIEGNLLKLTLVKSADANAGRGAVTIKFEGAAPSVGALNRIFKKENYVFSNYPKATPDEKNRLWTSMVIAAVFIVGFLIIKKSGLAELVNVGSKSSLLTFFVFGLLAGTSSCATLVGGLILSVSKQWFDIYPDESGTWQKFNPHLMFGVGRLLSYGFLGAILGLAGSQIKISLGFTSLLIVTVSTIMIILALQMLGAKFFKKFQLGAPKFITRYIADEKNFKGRYMPFILGFLTFFLPCGFTITAQGLALLSGNAWQGGLIMLFFALGTAPMLLLIGLSSVKFSTRPHLAYRFSKVAGFLILFFALFNINSQLNLIGWPSFNDLFRGSGQTTTTQIDQSGLPPIMAGKQLIKMDAASSSYNPNYFKVRIGIPVRWEITDKGTSGCTNAIISKNLFPDQIALISGQVSAKEFTPQKSGKYKFSCWMGMISGTIEVVENNI